MIQRAKIPQIPDILNLTAACTVDMERKGIYQWNKNYPSKEIFRKDIDRGELYVFEDSGKVIGMIVVSALMDDEYRLVEWLTPNKNNIFIHRLAVHPDFQGMGFAQKFMDYAENHAKQHDFVSVRLDTFSQNKRNQKFYEQRGYQKLGDIYFPKQSEHPFHCYELVL